MADDWVVVMVGDLAENWGVISAGVMADLLDGWLVDYLGGLMAVCLAELKAAPTVSLKVERMAAQTVAT